MLRDVCCANGKALVASTRIVDVENTIMALANVSTAEIGKKWRSFDRRAQSEANVVRKVW